MTGFDNYLRSEREVSLIALDRFILSILAKYSDLDPTFTTQLYEIQKYLGAGGKMHRPTLARIGYSITSNSSSNSDIITASLAPELLHRFILTHDDIIDRDVVRHGQATLEQIFNQESTEYGWKSPLPQHGSAMAMISGDIIHSLTHDLVLSCNLENSVIKSYLQGLSQCLVETAAGWRLETILKQQSIQGIEPDQVIKAMHLVSTQYSIVWPLRFGQLLAGTRLHKWDSTLEAYGREVGFIFQLQDDFLGVMGDQRHTGKPVGGDIREGKKTLLILHAYQKANPSQQQLIEQSLGQEISSNDLNDIRQILDETHTISWARAEMQKKATNALVVLNQKPESEFIKKLRELVTFLIERQW
jgi:geranylgeranyl pyrophosphate synthase